jgi:uncharacterized membrane protein YhhN
VVHRLTFGRLRNFGRMDAGLLLLSIASSAGYLAMRAIVPSSSGLVFKAMSIAPLAVLAFRVLGGLAETAGQPPGPEGQRRHDHLILAAALTLSSAGDVFLALDRRRYFGHALTVFLLAHVAYILLFARSWPRPLRPRGRQLLLTALVLIFGLALTSWLAPGLGSYTVPVMIYAGAITAMTVSAILAGFSRPYVLIGALLFMLSDSLIAAARFKAGWAPAAYLVWPTYYLGQYGISVGFLSERAADDRRTPDSNRSSRPA